MPKAAADILPWHQSAWRRLMDQNAAGRMPHALLLSGLPGTGKGQLAIRLATRLLCSDSSQDEACGSCRSCQQLGAGSHPDFHQLTVPEGKSQIGIDQVRNDLVSALQLSAQYGHWKVAIINPADRMNRNSFNALLKTLEEPSGRTIIILVSDRPARLPATIRSRCQQLRISLPVRAVALDWLQQRDIGKAELLLDLAGGAPLTALALQNSPWVGEREALCRHLLGLADGGGDPVVAAQAWMSLPMGHGLDWLRTLVQDLIRLRQIGPDAVLTNPDLRRELQSAAHRLDWQSLHRHLDELVRLRALSEAPLTPQLQWEGLMFAWSARLQPPPIH